MDANWFDVPDALFARLIICLEEIGAYNNNLALNEEDRGTYMISEIISGINGEQPFAFSLEYYMPENNLNELGLNLIRVLNSTKAMS